jgi:DnaJ-class molecular chaperone
MANKDCPKCHGTGMVKEKNGEVHTCFDCLMSGNMEQHSKEIKDSKIRI